MRRFLCLGLLFVSLFSAFLGVNNTKFVKISKFNDKNAVFAETETVNLSLAENAKSAYLIDYETESVIFSKNENEELPIASMTKMMSLSVVFDAIEEGKLKLEDKITISENAANIEGSQAFLDAGASYLVSDLIKTIIISSANDSTVALAERVAGNEKNFAILMNNKAKELGLTHTNFKNSTGLPEDGHYSSAKDCALIYKNIASNEIYKNYAHIWMDKLVHPSGRETELVNTNRLVKTYQGCASGKTGYTSEAGYCLTTSATRNGTTLIAVVIGEKDSKTRFKEVSEMLDYGFANFSSRAFFMAKDNKQIIKVDGAKKEVIEAAPTEDYFVFSRINEKIELDVNFIFEENKAPIKIGQKVGYAVITNKDGVVIKEIEIIATENAEKQNLFDALKKVLNKW